MCTWEGHGGKPFSLRYRPSACRCGTHCIRLCLDVVWGFVSGEVEESTRCSVVVVGAASSTSLRSIAEAEAATDPTTIRKAIYDM